MSKLRSGATPSDPSMTIAPASISSVTGQRPFIEKIELGLCEMRVPVEAISWISSSVRLVACERMTSGPSRPSTSFAYLTVPRVCPS